jgi:hypothetical protein
MPRFLIPILAALALTACDQNAGDPPPNVYVAAEPAADATSPLAETTPALSIEASCRQAVETLYGQSGAAVSFVASDFSVSWPAPVDGGRLKFACSVVGSQITLSNARQTQTIDLNAPAASPDTANSVGGN